MRPLKQYKKTMNGTRPMRRMDELPREVREALSEKFETACKKYVDPYEAAEKIGCRVVVTDDGMEVYY